MTDFDWEVYPLGLYTLLERLYFYYGFHAVYVTENGAAYDDRVNPDGEVHDPARLSYIQEHLRMVRKAISSGVPVMGYFVWSLLDNFEWGMGYSKRFDIVRVDYETQQRTPKSILQATLPQVDIFLPSLDEILYMLGKDPQSPLSPELLHEVSDELLAMGAKIVVIKLGDRGLYLRVASADVLQGLGKIRPTYLTAWSNYEAWQPCYQVDVAGTTGSGDATIAGFLSAFLRDMSPAKTLQAALAVGACSVEAPDALSGIRPWGETLNRIRAWWAQKEEPQAFAKINQTNQVRLLQVFPKIGGMP